ncbi:MAG: uroporphyrinogen decarboxylase family protein, partial [Ruthenibacterium sp.]
MNSKDLLHLTDVQLRHYESVDEKYKQMYTTPTRCEPMFIINTPVELPTWEERLADPAVMLKAELDLLRSHIAVGDDRAMTVRVQFGTAQVAAAFGCELCVPPNNLPAARTHVLHNAEDVYTMPLPALTAGWYKKLENFTEYYQANLPAGVHIQLPDIQSAFNTAHLIRGNDILLDFYDDPEALCALLDKVTDYLIALVPHLNGMIACPKGWFYDWGILWKGAARISNCSTHMISPAMYAEYIYPRDVRLMEAIGGGRVHYCG